MEPKVSVCMITYNQEKFLSQAIESVLEQKTNFDYELVIGEDCSIDKTREIIIKYQKKYPDRIKLLLREKNLGMVKNFLDTFKSCQGEYIAMLEGDDFWVCRDKLQNQVDFLESHPECSVCFHTVQAFYEDRFRWSYFVPQKEMEKDLYLLHDLLQCNFIANCSVMYRNCLQGKIPHWFYFSKIGDWPLHVLHAEFGDIGYIRKVMAKYRIHRHSNFSSRQKGLNYLDIIKTAQTIDRHFRYKYHSLVQELINSQRLLLQQEN